MDRSILDRYQSEDGASSYRRKFQKHWNERLNDRHERRLVSQLLERARGETPFRSALDAPCGWGRLYPLVRAVSDRVTEGDVSEPMLEQARAYHAGLEGVAPADHYEQVDALDLTFPDRHFDLVLSVRLCHHIRERKERLEYVRQILRVTDRAALFTFFDEGSFKNRLREFRRRFSSRRSKWTLRRDEIEELAREQGFSVTRFEPLSRLFSGHVYALLERWP